MRRSDREITDPTAIEAFLAQEQILRIAFCEAGEIYIVPVNYGYTCINGRYTFYFHGAKAGRKYTLAQKAPAVGFEIDGSYALVPGETACDYTACFQSVIGTGRLHLIESPQEKADALNLLMKQATHKAQWDYRPEHLEAVAVFRLDVESLSCKARKEAKPCL